MEKVRTFVALDLPPGLRGEAGRLIEEIAASGADVRWVPPEALHLTLKFMGSITRDRIDQSLQGTAAAAAGSPPFELELSGLGGFPSASRPRVVWIGAGRGEEALRRLAGEVELRLREVGFPAEDRPFQAHLTLGRVRGPRKLKALGDRMAALAARRLGTFRVESIAIYRSDLGPQGARYTQLGTAALGGAAGGEGG